MHGHADCALAQTKQLRQRCVRSGIARPGQSRAQRSKQLRPALLLVCAAAQAFGRLYAAFRAEFGQDLGITDWYRSYDANEAFPVGGSKTLRDGDDVALVAAGITVHEALRAAETLAEDGISARVVDCYSVKPIDAATLASLSMPIVTVEDHGAEGGLGEAVLAALAEHGSDVRVELLAVRELPHSGKPAELLDAAGIDAGHIAGAARALVRDAAGVS